ncbi:MAG: tetratricopeptide repeat protein [Endomicrobiaceae bacterium]|nr:tetratricopeptide repeat protein [Endomicrobiaceae bacterium]
MNKLKIFIFILSTVFMIGAYNYFISIKKINNRIADELKRGNFKDSETEFEKLLKKNKDNYILKFNYGNLKYKNSDYEESLDIYEKMLREYEINNTVKSEIYYNIGNIYFIYDDYDKALEYYKHSLFLNPKDTDAIYNTEYILNLIRKNEEIEKMTEAFKKDLTEHKNKINGEELKVDDVLKETKIQKQIKNEQFQKIDKDTEEKNKINVEYIKNDLDYLLQERQTLLSQKNDLEKAISGMQEQTSGSGLSEEKASENLKLQEQKKNLEMKLKENLKKSNNKVNMLEKLEDDLFQEVVRPEKVINPKKIIEGYFAPSYADDKKFLIEEEKEVIYRNLNQIDYADIEKKEEKKQIVYNMPPLEGDINKKSKYVYEHEDIIEYQNQQKNNSYVRNAFEQINLQKQKILENSSNEQSDILKEISEINKNILQKNINDEKQLMRQRQEAV